MRRHSQVAGVEDEPPQPAERKPSSQSKWTQQLEQNFAAAGSSSSGRTSSAHDPNAMVKIVGYNQESTAPKARPSASHDAADYSAGSNFGYDNIAGACVYCPLSLWHIDRSIRTFNVLDRVIILEQSRLPRT